MITAQDIREKCFEKARIGGYAMDEVDDFLDELAIFYPPTYHGGREYIDDQSFVARLKRHRIVLRSVPTPRTDTVSSLTNIETSLGAYSRFRVASLNAERSFERRIFR